MVSTRTALSKAGQAYVALVAATGIAVVLHSLYAVTGEAVDVTWFILAGLTLLSGSFTVRIPTIPARLSVSETFVFAAAILFGPAAATVIVVLDSLVISFWLRRASRNITRVLFNMAAPAIAIWVASHTFFQLAGVPPLHVQQQPVLSLVVPILVLALLYFLLNSWLIAGAVGFEKGLSPFVVWRDNFLWLSLNYFSGASVAALLLPYLQSDEKALIRVGVILIPPLLISYLTFKTALGRVDDATRHLTELNRLYLSTIETLAMAIDAKDQITHGHIRRVQQYAVGLAKKVGITDENQIRAIEAASLLHDMGKLAVPEYILNKPGKLTPAEFEKMKLHASVGADILSAIDFPYPVVPIVRHHHENWDGSGYPDQIQGSNIPIGARILSVVDCFDALTSDRPYRPRLSDAEAIAILLDRRGTMYDPLVVDTFIRVHADIAPSIDKRDTDTQDIVSSARDLRISPPAIGAGLDDIAAGTEEMIVLFELARNLSGYRSSSEATEIVATHIRRVIPASTCAFFTYETSSDELIATQAIGEHSDHFVGLRIPRGQRLTGWVAANRQTIVNSDPVLDLGETARKLRPRLLACLSTPVIHNHQLAGVLSLYSIHRDAFSETHRRIIEAVSRQISFAFKDVFSRTAGELDTLSRSLRDGTSRLASDGETAPSTGADALSIALITIAPNRNQSTQGSADRTTTYFAEKLRRTLRAADVLFRLAHDEFVILLAQTNADSARQVALRMIDELCRQPKAPAEDGLSMTIGVGTATAPMDGMDMNSLIRAARLKMTTADNRPAGPTSIH